MNIGALRHRVSVMMPNGPAVPDGYGGYTQPEVTLASRVPASVLPATARSLERVTANTVTANASHTVTLRFVPGVTTAARLIFHDGSVDRPMSVTGVHDTQERHQELILECQEAV